MLRRGLHRDEGPVEVGRDGVAPLVEGHLEERRVVAGAGVGHEDVDAAQLRDQAVDDGRRAGEVGDVDLLDEGLAAGLPDLFRGLLGPVGLRTGR